MQYRYPFSPFPSGWFAVGLSDELGAGAISSMSYLGRDLVAFRSSDGAAHVLDAHCPHLGAHLGQGTLADDCVRCPFHGWSFDRGGACVDIPYSSRIPDRARVRTYPVVEWAGFVLAFHGGDDEQPAWELELPDLDADWTLTGRRSWRARVHVQEIGENGLDVAHVADVHGAPVPDLTRAEGVDRCFFIETRPKPGCPSAAYLDGIDRTLWGMGVSMNEFRGAVTARVVITRTPIDEQHTEITAAFLPRTLETPEKTQAIGDLLRDRIGDELEQDIPIWEHKRYVEQPLLVKGDGPVMAWRNWCRQFY